METDREEATRLMLLAAYASIKDEAGYKRLRKPGEPKNTGGFRRLAAHSGRLAAKMAARKLKQTTEETTNAVAKEARRVARAHKFANLAKQLGAKRKRQTIQQPVVAFDVLSVMRADARKRAAPWEGVGRRD